MRRFLSTRPVRRNAILVSILCLSLVLGRTVVDAVATAQQPAPTAADNDDARKKAIFASPEWRQARMAFNEWLSVQETYDAQQVAQMRADLDRQISAMTADQLEDFLAEMQARLQVLMSPEASDARRWLANYMAVASASRREQMRERLPDVANMTSAQIEAALAQFQAERRSQQQAVSQQNAARQQRVQANLQAQQQAEASRERALQRATRSSSPSRASGYMPAPNRPFAPTYSGSNTVFPAWGWYRW